MVFVVVVVVVVAVFPSFQVFSRIYSFFFTFFVLAVCNNVDRIVTISLITSNILVSSTRSQEVSTGKQFQIYYVKNKKTRKRSNNIVYKIPRV